MLSAGGIRHQFSERVNVELSLYGSEFLKSLGTTMQVDGHDTPDVQFVEGGYMFMASSRGLDTLHKNYEVQRCVHVLSAMFYLPLAC
jgi:FAD-dependent oxidoreductase domain-containing protein 1